MLCCLVCTLLLMGSPRSCFTLEGDTASRYARCTRPLRSNFLRSPPLHVALASLQPNDDGFLIAEDHKAADRMTNRKFVAPHEPYSLHTAEIPGAYTLEDGRLRLKPSNNFRLLRRSGEWCLRLTRAEACMHSRFPVTHMRTTQT